MHDFRIEPGGSHETICECCGQLSRTVSRFAYLGDEAAAAYFVQWTVGGVDTHGANFDLIIGKWGEGATARDRSSVALEFRRTDRGPSFIVIDASARPAGRSDLVSRALAREEVVGTPIAKSAFKLVDAVWLHDGRIGEIVGAG
jgi:hypothetical protein